jgi:hypothetical protein
VTIFSGDGQFGLGSGVHPVGWWLVGLVVLATVSFAALRLLVSDNDAAVLAFVPLLGAVLLVRFVTWPPTAYVGAGAFALAELALVAYCFRRRS